MQTLRLNMELRDLHHEFRTPLTGSLGASNLLLDTKLTAEQRELVNMIIESNERLLNFVNNYILNNPIEEELESNQLIATKNKTYSQPTLFLKLAGIESAFFKKMNFVR